jgi:phage terminase small subunit
MAKPKPPAHLAPATAAWWRTVHADFVLEPHHVRLLTLAAEAWDRCEEARSLLKRDGIVVDGRQGLRPHPAVAIERDSRLAFVRIVRELNLETEPERGPGRPPRPVGWEGPGKW